VWGLRQRIPDPVKPEVLEIGAIAGREVGDPVMPEHKGQSCVEQTAVGE